MTAQIFQEGVNPALQQLRSVVVPNRVLSVTQHPATGGLEFTLSNGGRMLITGGFHVHTEPGNSNPEVIDVIAKETQE